MLPFSLVCSPSLFSYTQCKLARSLDEQAWQWYYPQNSCWSENSQTLSQSAWGAASLTRCSLDQHQHHRKVLTIDLLLPDPSWQDFLHLDSKCHLLFGSFDSGKQFKSFTEYGKVCYSGWNVPNQHIPAFLHALHIQHLLQEQCQRILSIWYTVVLVRIGWSASSTS